LSLSSQRRAEAAAEINELLEQLAQNELTIDEDNNSVALAELFKKIKYNPALQDRLRSAFHAGGIEALKAIFNHPSITIPIDIIKNWIQVE
jgi:hypothetical protein